MRSQLFPVMASLLIASCRSDDVPPESQEISVDEPSELSRAASLAMDRELNRIDAEMARVDSIFQPLPLLQPGQESALRRFGNAQQLARARALGIGPQLPSDSLVALEADGGLVRLADTDYWVIRDLDYSQPLAVRGVEELLTEVGQRFSARLADHGAPAFRFEVSSILRTVADQAALRQVNANAASGESTHEYGTTVDILYSAFSAPAHPIIEVDIPEAPWLIPYLERYASTAAGRVGARRALELKAILGEVLIEMQNEGAVMVTLERLQPVFHMTLATPD